MPALRVNVPELDPCGITMLDGMIAPAGDELSATVTPPLGAADVNATVHVAVDGGVIDTALHENPFSPNDEIVTVAPLPDTASEEPPPSEASRFVRLTADDGFVLELDTPMATVATTPLPIVAALEPESTHVNDPVFELHDKDLFPAAGPAANVADEKSAVE